MQMNTQNKELGVPEWLSKELADLLKCMIDKKPEKSYEEIISIRNKKNDNINVIKDTEKKLNQEELSKGIMLLPMKHKRIVILDTSADNNNEEITTPSFRNGNDLILHE